MSNEIMIFDKEKENLLRDMFFKEFSESEFKMFIYACQRTGLDPFMKQIYAVKRWDTRLKKNTMTIQTSIDGYRLIAERTGKYCPGRKPVFEYDENKNLISATSYVKKLTEDGIWHEIDCEAFFDEYCQTVKDKITGEVKTIGMWGNMQRNQLAKCAESLALRKAFPAEMSGIYTKDEMKKSYEPTVEADIELKDIQKISAVNYLELKNIIDECSDDYRNCINKFLKDQYGDESLANLEQKHYERMKKSSLKKRKEHFEKQKEQFMIAELSNEQEEIIQQKAVGE